MRRENILVFQRDEETGYAIYTRMAANEQNTANRGILLGIAADEKRHAEILRARTGRNVGPERFKLFWYALISWILGYTFLIKLMERFEASSIGTYQTLAEEWPELNEVIVQEQEHEGRLLEMLDEERLRFISSMVLGLNDALVELTGTLAGLTFALANNRLVALAGIITGVSAALSMAASNYLAERNRSSPDAFKSSLYTGTAYLVTVALLVAPYLLFPPRMPAAAFLTMLALVILIILAFNYYVSVAKSQPFASRFAEMACLSLGAALVAFLLGILAKHFLPLDLA